MTTAVDAIDISHWQPTFTVELLRAWRELGLERVIVKLGGANNSVYVSRDHAEKTANARAAGLRVQHYWFNGRDAALDVQARMIAAHVPPGERLWWDVEHEGSTRRWSPAEVVQAARALDAAGVPLAWQGVYMSESVTREEDWSPVVALGLPLWVAAYRTNDGSVPAAAPRVSGWPGFALWQYTDRGQLPGFLGALDLNMTRGGIPEGGRMVTVSQLRAWMPRTPSDKTTWYMWCQRLMWVVCEDWGIRTSTYGSAIEAYRASRIVSPDASTAPPGAFHYWAWSPDGHVGLELGGGQVLMTAAKNVPFLDTWAVGAGVVDVHEFNRRSGLAYLGWARTNGANSVTISSGGFAGKGEDDMFTDEDRALLANIAGFIYGGGTSASDPNYTGMPGTIYELLKTPVHRGEQRIPQIQDNADTNTMVRELLARRVADVTLPDTAVAALVTGLREEVAKGLDGLDVTLGDDDVDRIADRLVRYLAGKLSA